MKASGPFYVVGFVQKHVNLTLISDMSQLCLFVRYRNVSFIWTSRDGWSDSFHTSFPLYS